MAVQQNKKSPSKRGMHRAHDYLTSPSLAIEPTTGETHLRHHVSPTGFYRVVITVLRSPFRLQSNISSSPLTTLSFW